MRVVSNKRSLGVRKMFREMYRNTYGNMLPLSLSLTLIMSKDFLIKALLSDCRKELLLFVYRDIVRRRKMRLNLI